MKGLHSLIDTMVPMGSMKENFSSVVAITSPAEAIALLLVVAALLVLQLFITTILWNRVLTKMVSFVKPVESIWQMLGFVILTMLLFT